MPQERSKQASRKSRRTGRARAAVPRETFGGIPLSLVRRYRNRLGAPAADGGRAPVGQPARHSTA